MSLFLLRMTKAIRSCLSFLMSDESKEEKSKFPTLLTMTASQSRHQSWEHDNVLASRQQQ